MKTTSKKRDAIVERLSEIKADPNANPEIPTSSPKAFEAEKLDKETTKLLRELVASDPDKPAKL